MIIEKGDKNRYLVLSFHFLGEEMYRVKFVWIKW